MTVRQAWVEMRCARTGRPVVARFRADRDGFLLCEARLASGSEAPVRGVHALQGRFDVAAEYEGCPDCGNRGFIQCDRCCGLGCWYGEGPFLCRSCGNHGYVERDITGVAVTDIG